MTSLLELRRRKGSLDFSRKLLTGAVLFQIPFVVEIVLRQSDILFRTNLIGTWQMPGKVTTVLWVGSAVLAIAGFTLVCRQLSLWEGDLENTEFAQRTRLLGSRKIAAGAQMMFYLSFLVPVLSLLSVLWARAQASAAMRAIDAALPSRAPAGATVRERAPAAAEMGDIPFARK